MQLVHISFCLQKSWARATPGIKPLSLNAQQIQVRHPAKHVHCADTQNAVGREKTKIVVDGKHGKICVLHQRNIQIGAAPHQHAVVRKGCVKKHPFGCFLFLIQIPQIIKLLAERLIFLVKEHAIFSI